MIKFLSGLATVLFLSASVATAADTLKFRLAIAVGADTNYVYVKTVRDTQTTLGDSVIAPPVAPDGLTGNSMPINNSVSCLSGLFGAAGSSDVPAPLLDGIGIWSYNDTPSDNVLGIDYIGSKIYNFSLLSSSNLMDWSMVCTVVGWTGLSHDSEDWWVCQVTYTNSVPYTAAGIPVSTNWIRLQRDGNDPASLIVYGDVYAGPLKQAYQFYRLSCNTNVISTAGP
jgi:hypothetical protein